MSNLYKIVVVLLVLLLKFNWGCVNDPSLESNPPGINGIVLNHAGIPICDVGVHYIFYTKYNRISSQVTIEFGFDVTSMQPVTVQIFNPRDIVVATLLDGDTILPGSNAVGFNSPVTNGIYRCRIVTLDTIETVFFDRRNDSITWLSTVDPLVRTDQTGSFYLSMSNIGYGKQVESFQPDEVLLDSISIILIKDGYQPYRETFRIDTAKTTTKIFRMADQPR